MGYRGDNHLSKSLIGFAFFLPLLNVSFFTRIPLLSLTYPSGVFVSIVIWVPSDSWPMALINSHEHLYKDNLFNYLRPLTMLVFYKFYQHFVNYSANF